MNALRGRLSFANVMSVIAVCIALGGTSYAAFKLPKNSVGTKQLKKNSVTKTKIKNGAVTSAKIADGSIIGPDIKDGSLTGADIDQSSLTKVNAANVIGIAISGDENCTPLKPLPPGVTSRRFTGFEGECEITFPNPVTGCAATATIRYRLAEKTGVVLTSRDVQLVDVPTKPTTLHVDTFEGSSMVALPFDLVLVC